MFDVTVTWMDRTYETYRVQTISHEDGRYLMKVPKRGYDEEHSLSIPAANVKIVKVERP